MAVTPTANSYTLGGMLVAPTEDFGYGQNPYDPDTQPELWAQWQGQHQGDAQQIGQDYSPGRVGAIIGGTIAAGGLGAFSGGAAPSLATSGIPSATGVGAGGALAGGGVLPGAATLGGIGAGTVAAPAVAGTAAGFGPEFGATGPAAAMTTASGNIGSPALAAAGGAGAGSSFLSQLARYIGPAASVAQTLIGRNATNTARDQLVAANAQAATQLKGLYGNTANTLGGIAQRQQQNLAPYVSLGGGAAGLLGQGLGINVPAPNVTPFVPSNPFDNHLPGENGPPQTGNGFQGSGPLAPSYTPGVTSPYLPVGGRSVPAGATPGAGATPRTGAATGGVRMQAPTGEIAVVDPSHVAAAQAAGAKILTGGA